MKKFLSLFLIFFVFINIFSTVSFAKAEGEINSPIDRATIVYELVNPEKVIKVGDTFKVNVYVTSNNNKIPINYIASITKFNTQVASFIKTENTGSMFSTIFMNKVLNGVLTYKAGKAKGWYGTKGLLVSLTFKALKIGSFNMSSDVKSLIFTDDTVDLLFGKISNYHFALGSSPLPDFSYSSNKITLIVGKNTMNVDGKIVNLDTAPIIKDNRTLLPVRAIAESTNCSISWDAKSSTALINEQNGSTIALTIGNPVAILNNFAEKQIDPNNPKVVPIIINSRTMLPIRFVAESMGFDVTWMAETKTIILIK